MVNGNLIIRVPGNPVAQPRIKARRAGEHATVYTPTTANAWKDAVAHFAQKAAAASGWVKPDANIPLRVDCDFHFRRPSGYRKVECWKRTKPDRDNLDKAILDALVWADVIHDDAQVVDGTPRKLIDDDWQGAIITIALAGIP